MTTAVSTSRGSWRRSLAPRAAGVVYAFLALLAILTITSAAQSRPSYLSSVNLSNILDQSALIAILAVFMTVVLISGNFDLSVASTAALSGTVALKTIDSYGPVLAFVFALLAGAAVGAINAVLVQKVGVNAFIVTLGTLTAVRGVVQAVLDGQSITASDTTLFDFATAKWTLPTVVAIVLAVLFLVAAAWLIRRGSHLSMAIRSSAPLWAAGLGLLALAVFRPLMLTQTAPVWIMLVLATVTALVLRFTVLGRNLYAVGGNAEAARLSGIDVDRYKMGAFVVNGTVAAMVGVLYAGRFNSVDPTVLTGGELTVIAAAVLGGTSLFGGSGFVSKSVVGTLILFTLSNGFNVLNIGSNYQNVVQGTVLVAAASLYTATSQRERRSFRERLNRRRGGPAPRPSENPPSPAAGPATPPTGQSGRPGQSPTLATRP